MTGWVSSSHPAAQESGPLPSATRGEPACVIWA
jgi:hypothetical protein